MSIEHRKGTFKQGVGPFQGQSSYKDEFVAFRDRKMSEAKSNVHFKPLDSLMTSPEIHMIAKKSRLNDDHEAY